MSWVNPVAGRISSKFGNRLHPVTKVYALHGGTDIAAATGTAVKAASGGTVTAVANGAISGRIVELDHGGGIRTRYHHLSAQLVRVGQKVKTGEVIARVGATGRVTGAHLHFEVRKSGAKIDPQPFMRARGVELGSNEKIPITGGIDVAKLPIVRAGAKGVHVGIMQGALISRGYSVGKHGVDKSNGPATQKAVKAYQKKNPTTGTNGKPDGVCGPKMWAHLLGV